MDINLQSPAVDEFEISLFGPGTGECIVAHLGHGDWMVVDSCTARESKEPVALEYLRKLGVSCDQVKVVLITHFHDDHIRGIGEVIRCCTAATVCISDALTQAESVAFVKAYGASYNFADKDKPSAHEINNIVDLMDASERHFIWASDSKVLYRNNDVVVHALSPSNQAISQSRLDFAQAFEETRNSVRRLARRLSENLCAVALHVCNGTDTILLGSDLEVTAANNIGWGAILASSTKPTMRAQLFKVPHHGSVTGHSDQVVDLMLAHKPLSILTTMNTSHLPRPEDLERIKGYSNEVYHTTQPMLKPPKRERAVEEIMRQVAKVRRVPSGEIGHVQVRMQQGQILVATNRHASKAA